MAWLKIIEQQSTSGRPIVLSKDANSNLGMSMITKKIAEEVEGEVAYLAQTPES